MDQYKCLRCLKCFSRFTTLRTHCERPKLCAEASPVQRNITRQSLLQHCHSLRKRRGIQETEAEDRIHRGLESSMMETVQQLSTSIQDLAKQSTILTESHNCLLQQHKQLSEQYEHLKGEHGKLSEELQQMRVQLSNPTSANVTVNNVDNVNIILLNNFGSEDMSFLKKDSQAGYDYIIASEVLEKGVTGMAHLVKLCHFDARAPRNHNVSYNEMSEEVRLHEDTEWVKYPKEDGTQLVIDNVLPLVHKYVIDNIGIRGMFEIEDVTQFVMDVVSPSGHTWEECSWLDMEDPLVNSTILKRSSQWPKELLDKRKVLFEAVKHAMIEGQKTMKECGYGHLLHQTSGKKWSPGVYTNVISK